MLKKIRYNSPVVLSFALISFIALILNMITSGKINHLLFSTYRNSLTSPLMYIRLFTHVLGHSSLQHYTNNMAYILLLGPMLEEKYGSKKLLICIAVTAFITGIANNLLFRSSLLGASGIVFMMIVMSSMTSIKSGTIPLTFILVVIIYLGQEVYSALFVYDNISQFTHIVGGLCGGYLGYILSKKSW